MLSSRASGNTEVIDLDTGKIKEWKSIITLIVFVLTSKLATACTSSCSNVPGQISTCSSPFTSLSSSLEYYGLDFSIFSALCALYRILNILPKFAMAKSALSCVWIFP